MRRMSGLKWLAQGALLACCLLLLSFALPAQANTPITLWKAFDGRVNFAGTQVTLRTGSNTDKGKNCNGDGNGNNGNCLENGNNGNKKVNACTVTAPSTNRTAALVLPSGATVLSAQLYWAGSGPSDSTVSFEGRNVTAARKYVSRTVGGGLNYFGGAADVTSVVRAKGSGTYDFSGLTVETGDPWCASQAVLGGFSLLVVYSHAAEPERVLNIYEGFQHVQNSEVVVNANNFRWKSPLIAVRERARVGHITWEGDPTLEQGGESLLFEGKELSDALNPPGNQFNSRSNINNDSASYGIDFDAYDTEVRDWTMDDATVTTRYRTGQDLVLLNVEVLVVPTAPVSDLSIALARSGSFQVGLPAEYTATVTNHGPYTETGRISVAIALPNGMRYLAGSGTGWTCAANGSNGSCSWQGALAPGASAPPLLLTAAVDTTGQKTVTVTVTGTGDDNPANNAASLTDTAIDRDVSTNPTPGTLNPYVFTDSLCAPGIAIGAPGQPCKRYAAPIVGGSKAPIFITATNDGIPGAPASATTASIQFAIECLNPVAGTVGASYAGAAIPACAAAGQPLAWSAPVAIAFAAGTVSRKLDFIYKDVGQIRLSLKESGNTAATGDFVSAPLRIAFRDIRNGSISNPGNTAPASLGFAAAGAPLTVEIGAWLADEAGFAPNFGNEKVRPGISLGRAAIDGIALASVGELFETGSRGWKDGIMSATASWSEVGAIAFVTGLVDASHPDDASRSNLYLGVPVGGSTVAVGRFYPAYFKTIVTGPFECPASLPAGYACPRDDRGAVYSGQPFTITVEAFNDNNERLQNFTGAWFRPVTLSAVNKPGGQPLAPDLVPEPGKQSVAITDANAPLMQAKAPYRLAAGYKQAEPRATNLSAPTAVFVRATAAETALTEDGKPEIVVSSLRSNEVSDEGGVLVLNGRLKVPNALGTDILRTALGLRAEYWGGASGWLFNPEFADAPGVGAGATRFLVCSKQFARSDGSCDTGILAASTRAPVEMKKGRAVLWLLAPGKRPGGVARSGSVTLEFAGWPWLPSTIGRVSYGSHRSPVIYMRELYF